MRAKMDKMNQKKATTSADIGGNCVHEKALVAGGKVNT